MRPPENILPPSGTNFRFSRIKCRLLTGTLSLLSCLFIDKAEGRKLRNSSTSLFRDWETSVEKREQPRKRNNCFERWNCIKNHHHYYRCVHNIFNWKCQNHCHGNNFLLLLLPSYFFASAIFILHLILPGHDCSFLRDTHARGRPFFRRNCFLMCDELSDEARRIPKVSGLNFSRKDIFEKFTRS